MPARRAGRDRWNLPSPPLTNHPPFRPAWWLPGPHLPTVWGKLARRIPDAHDRIERWPTPDGDAVSIARVEPPYSAIGLFFGDGMHGGVDFDVLVSTARTPPVAAFTAGELPGLGALIADEARDRLADVWRS